jgi:hypothetical protein
MFCIECFLAGFQKNAPSKMTDNLDPEGAMP